MTVYVDNNPRIEPKDDGFTFILTRPQMGENIGAAARIMCNFGFSDLRIVAPRDGWPNEKATAMAAGAKHLIEQATLYNTLAEALADCHYAAALTARPRDLELPVHTPREWTNQRKNVKTALIFGPERSGLENEEVALCNSVIQIPVSPDYPSVNLAQAVAVICYELCAGGSLQASPQEDVATKEELHGFFDQLEAGLNAGGFWRVEAKKPAMWRNIRAIFQRTTYTSQEIRTLRGIVSCLGKAK